MSKIIELRNKRNTLWEQTKAFLEQHRDENGLVAADAVEQYDKMAADVKALGDEIKRLEDQMEMDAKLSAPTSAPVHTDPKADTRKAARPTATDAYNKAFWEMMRGNNSLEVRDALSVGVPSEGGYTVPDEFERQLIQGLEENNIFRTLAHTIHTNSGTRTIPIATDSGSASWIFRRYLAGDSGYSIAKALKEQGVIGQNGVPMCDSTIKDIVTNISYTGTMILQKNYFTESHVRKRNKGELPRYAVEEMYEPLVSVEDFERAQAIRQRRAEESPNANSQPTRFSGLVKCGNCGRGISRRTAGGVKKWVCNTRERKGSDVCDMRPLMETELEAAATSAVGTVDDDEFRRLVCRIYIYGDRIEFRLANGKIKSVVREYGGYKCRNGFSGKLFCGECGAKLGRDTWGKKGVKKQSWGCTAPRCSCSLRRLPEEELRRASASILATADYEPAFVEKVRQAVVFNDGIRFEFKDGTVKTWQRE